IGAPSLAPRFSSRSVRLGGGGDRFGEGDCCAGGSEGFFGVDCEESFGVCESSSRFLGDAARIFVGLLVTNESTLAVLRRCDVASTTGSSIVLFTERSSATGLRELRRGKSGIHCFGLPTSLAAGCAPRCST